MSYKEPLRERLLFMLVVFLLVAFVGCVLSGCTTAKKATRFMNEHPEVSAAFCAEKYPIDTVTTIKDSLVTDTLLLEDVKYLFDTIYVEGKPLLIKQQCPPSKVITQTKYQTIERVVENTAKVAQYEIEVKQKEAIVAAKEAEITEYKAEAKQAKEGRSKWRLWCLITWAVCGGYIFLKVRRIIPF
jgi:hypothetical protein